MHSSRLSSVRVRTRLRRRAAPGLHGSCRELPAAANTTSHHAPRTMQLLFDRYTVHPRVAFAIARSSTTAYERVRVRLIDDGLEGWGEAAPNVFYEETADTVVEALGKLR